MNLIELKIYDSSQDASVEDSESIRSVWFKKINQVQILVDVSVKRFLFKCVYSFHCFCLLFGMLDINNQYDVVALKSCVLQVQVFGNEKILLYFFLIQIITFSVTHGRYFQTWSNWWGCWIFLLNQKSSLHDQTWVLVENLLRET